MSDDETMSDVPHPFVIGPAPSQASQAAAHDFLSYSTERTEAISAAISTLVRLPPDVMASIFLANIPVDDSMDRKENRKLVQALDYVKAGIQHRSKHRGVYFCDGKVKLPDETFIHVMGFLDKRDLIDNISHVSFAWAKASLSPTIRRWQTIDDDEPAKEGLDPIPGERLLPMLRRPQFALLKKLIVDLQLTDSLIEEIAQACPRLEMLKRSEGITTHFSSEIMGKLPTLFPKMKFDRIEVYINQSSSSQGVIRFVETLGIHLVELKVGAHPNTSGLTDDDFVIISRHCPNLRSFSYRSNFNGPHVHSRNLAALVEGCQRLEELELVEGTCRIVDLEAFSYIALNAKNLRLLNVQRTWNGNDIDKKIRKRLAKRLERTASNKRCKYEYSLSPLP